MLDAIRKQVSPLAIATFGLFCLCLPIALLKDIVHVDPALKILTIVVSWPVAILIVSLVFLARFQGAIDSFLRNVRSVQFPGGNIQAQSPATVATSATGQIMLTAEQRDNWINYVSDLERQHHAANASSEELQTQLDSTSMTMFIWKFRYLNQFFAFATKQVLLWFAQTGPQTRDTFNQAWQIAISDVNQRGIILEVLLQFGMLVTGGTALQITPEGYRFLQFIGFIPYAPPPQETT